MISPFRLIHIYIYIYIVIDRTNYLWISSGATCCLFRFYSQELRLTGHNLFRVPLEIASLVQLKLLNLRQNQIVEFAPECITTPVCSWEELDLENNQLTVLPATLKYCTKLRKLRLGCNGLQSLPPCIEYLTALETCIVPHNHLTTLPPELSRLPQLRILDLSSNHLLTLDPLDFTTLPQLVELKVNMNELSDLPVSIADSPLLELAVYVCVCLLIDLHESTSSRYRYIVVYT
jgi:Leucine-rich repeat (LRR) protein